MPPPDTLFTDSFSLSPKKKAGFPILNGWLKYIAPLILLCLALSLVYRDVLVWLIEVWHGKVYSHGFLVPFISLYLVWEQRERFWSLPTKPAVTSGAVIILACLTLLLVSRFSAIIQIEALSFFFIIPGIILLLCGGKILRAALLPWLYLTFMIPWLDPILHRIQLPFQLASSIMGAALLNLFFPVYRNGVYIQLPNITMQVATECSGVSFLISILAIGIPLVYLTQRTWARALLVLVVGCMLTILSNGLRVALAGVMGQCYGPELLHGPNHIFQGWFIAWIGWIGLFLFNWAIAKYSSKTPALLHERWKRTATASEVGVPRHPQFQKRLFCTVFLFFLCYGVGLYVEPRPVPLPAALSSLPLLLGEWNGIDEPWLKGDTLFPHADASLSRLYRSTSGSKVYLYIAYYEQQSEPKRLVSQYSRPLHKGSNTISLQDTVLNSLPLVANRGVLDVGDAKYDTVFWYQFPGHVAASGRNKARLDALTNGIFAHSNAGAIVLLGTPASKPSTEEGSGAPVPIGLFLKATGKAISGLLP